MDLDLSNRVAVVTGASGKLGGTIALTLARAGANVVVHYLRSQEKAESVAREIRGLGRSAITVRADVSSEQDILAMRDRVERELGAADIIVNNAVIQYEWRDVLSQPVAGYESQFRSTVIHNVLMCQAFVPSMIERGWGRVVAVSTECAMQNFAGQSAYVAGKRGTDGMLRALAREVGQHRITVNQVVMPGRPRRAVAHPGRRGEPTACP